MQDAMKKKVDSMANKLGLGAKHLSFISKNGQ